MRTANAAPRREEAAAVVEFLDAVLEGVDNEDVPAPVDGHARGQLKLSRPAANTTPRREEGAAVVEFLDTRARARDGGDPVADDDVPAPVDRHDVRPIEMSRPA